MASTIYYGKSGTERDVSVKEVVMEEIPNFQPGDILSVYFTFGNLCNGPTLVITNGDVNHNNAISNDTGLSILAPGQGTAVIGSWTDGEVVNFSYTEVPNNVFYWELIGKSIATDTIYGGVLLDATGDNENNSAISVGAAKRLLSSAAVGSISYETRQFESDATEIGDLTLTTYNPATGDTNIQTAVIKIPQDATYPPISRIVNDMAYISESSATVTSGILFKSTNNSNDTLRVGDDSDSSTVINLNSNGNLTLTPVNGDTVINSGLTVNGAISGTFNATAPSTIPNLTVDTINITTDGEGLTVQGNTHLQGNTIIDSLNINGTDLDSYISNKIEEDFLKHAYRIFEGGANQHLRWVWHTAENINVAKGAVVRNIDLEDYGLKGYRTVGIISWYCNSGYANLYGFTWTKSTITDLNDHLWANVYNCGTADITGLTIKVLVLLVRSNSFDEPLLEGTQIIFDNYGKEIEDENRLMGTLNSQQEFSFNIDNHCSDWDVVANRPKSIMIGNTVFEGNAIESFIDEIYKKLYLDRPRQTDVEVKTVIKYQKEQYQLVAYTLSTQPVACWIKLRDL